MSFGLAPVIAGSIRPTPPRNSQTPMKDEQVLRHGGKPRHVLERLIPQGRLVTEDFTEAGEAEEDAPQHLHAPKCGIHGSAWLVHCFAILLHSRLLSRLRRPVGRFNAETLCVLGVQSLPAAELHGLGADDASNRLTREEPLKDVEADVPARGAPRDEAAIDVVPQHQARAAATKGS